MKPLLATMVLLLMSNLAFGQGDAKEKHGFTGKAIAVHAKGQSILLLDQPEFKTIGKHSFVVGRVPTQRTMLWIPLVEVFRIEEFADLNDLNKNYQVFPRKDKNDKTIVPQK